MKIGSENGVLQLIKNAGLENCLTSQGRAMAILAYRVTLRSGLRELSLG
jgi:hypothetical protein